MIYEIRALYPILEIWSMVDNLPWPKNTFIGKLLFIRK